MSLLRQIAPPIAMLHSVTHSTDKLSANWCISPKAFLQLLDVIEEAGLITTHFAELTDAKKGISFLSRRVILTFDDCARHLFDTAVPELVKRNMKAIFYMPTAYIGGYNQWDVQKGADRQELMNEGDLKELVRLGMEVGSHSHHHTDLKLADAAEGKKEVTVSKQILETLTGRPVYSFAYPYGSVPRGYQTLLADAGYHYAVSIYQPLETPLALRRFGIYEKDTPATLSRKLSGRYRWMRKMYDAVKRY